MSTKMPRKITAMAMSVTLTPRLSVVTERRPTVGATGRASATSDIGKPPAAPGLEQVDGEEEREGQHQHDRRYGHRAGIVEFGQPDDDEQRRDLGNERDVAGDEDDRP